MKVPEPSVGSIAHWEWNDSAPSTSPGHVAYVEEIVDANTIKISEDIFSSGPFRWRTLTRSGDWPTRFLHIKDINVLAQPEPSLYGDPKGSIDLTRRTPSGVQMVGWAFDPDDTANPINVDIYGNKGYIETADYRGGVYANEVNAAVGNAFGIDPHKGYTATFPSPMGQEHLCMYGINVGLNGTTRRNSCSDITVSGEPKANSDRIYRVPGGAKLEGWAFDPDTAVASDVHFYGSEIPDPTLFRGGTTASLPRPDVESSLSNEYVGYGPNHGYIGQATLGSGAMQHVCAFALNKAGTGGSLKKGCADIDMTGQPIGTLEAVDRMPDQTVRVAGWGFDLDVSNPGEIHIYSATGPNTPQTFLTGFPTNVARGDVQAAYPGYDALRGFDVYVSVPYNR